MEQAERCKRGRWKGIMGDKGGRVFRNYKGHMNKTKREWKQGRELGMAAVVGRVGCGG